MLISLLGCSDPDTSYEVKITAIEKNRDSVYCVYRTEAIGEPAFERGFFLDDCDKYNVGEIITLTY